MLRLMTSGALLLPALLGLSISTVVQPLEPADMPTTPSAASVLTQHLAPVAIGMQSSVPATVPWISQYRQIANVSATAEPPRNLLASIAARTRITTHPAEVGATSIHVKMASGFQAGARVRINPAGATEEDNVLTDADSFSLERPLRYMHGLGETVLQLGGGAAIERVRTSVSLANVPAEAQAVQAEPQPLPQAQVPTTPTPPVGVHSHAHTQASGLARRDPPLPGSVSELFSRASLYMRGRWGLEAAVLLLMVLLASLLMAGYAHMGSNQPPRSTGVLPARSGFPAPHAFRPRLGQIPDACLLRLQPLLPLAQQEAGRGAHGLPQSPRRVEGLHGLPGGQVGVLLSGDARWFLV